MLVTRIPPAPFFTLLILHVLYALSDLALSMWAFAVQTRTIRDVQARHSIAGLVANLREPKNRLVKGKGIEGLFGGSSPSRPDEPENA